MGSDLLKQHPSRDMTTRDPSQDNDISRWLHDIRWTWIRPAHQTAPIMRPDNTGPITRYDIRSKMIWHKMIYKMILMLPYPTEKHGIRPAHQTATITRHDSMHGTHHKIWLLLAVMVPPSKVPVTATVRMTLTSDVSVVLELALEQNIPMIHGKYAKLLLYH